MKRHIPNALTCCNLLCGCLAMGAACYQMLDYAMGFIVLGAVFDFFDGFAARLLHVSSPIGKELDFWCCPGSDGGQSALVRGRPYSHQQQWL